MDIVDPFKPQESAAAPGIVDPYKAPAPMLTRPNPVATFDATRPGAPAPKLTRSWGEAAGDVGRAVMSGAAGLVKTGGELVGLATGDMNNAATELADNAQEYWQSGQSASLKRDQAARKAAIDASPSTLGKVGTAVWETLKRPSLLADTAAENAMTMLPAGIAGRGGKALAGLAGAGEQAAARVGVGAAIGTAGVQQGADVAQQAYDGALANTDWANNPDFQQRVAAGEAPEAVQHDIALNAARLTFPGATAVSLASQALPGGATLERALVGGAARSALTRPGIAGVATGVAKGVLGEGTQEAVEEGGGQFVGNLVRQQTVDPNTDLAEDVGENAGIGFVGGALLGGPAGAVHGAGGHGAQQGPLTRAAAKAPSVPFPDAQPGSLSDAANLIRPGAAAFVGDARGNVQDVRPPAPAPNASMAPAEPVPAPVAAVGGEQDADAAEAPPAGDYTPAPPAVPWFDQATGEMRQPTSDEIKDQFHRMLDQASREGLGMGVTAASRALSNAWGVPRGRLIVLRKEAIEERKAGITPETRPAEAAPAQEPTDAKGATGEGVPLADGTIPHAQDDAGAAPSAPADARSAEANAPAAEEPAQQPAPAEVRAEPAPAPDAAAVPPVDGGGRDAAEPATPQSEGAADAGRDGSIAQPAKLTSGEAPLSPAPAAAEAATPDAPPEAKAPAYDESPEQQDSDITTSSGSPFTIRNAAEIAAKRHDGGKVFAVDGGYVVRTPATAPAASKSDTGIPVSEQKQGDASAPPAAPKGGNETVAPSPAQATASTSSPAVEAAAREAAMHPENAKPEPTEAQKEAGNYSKGHVNLHGLDISIENPAGTSRRPEWPPLKHAYGYIKRTEGGDGEHVDVFMGQHAEDASKPVFVIDQVHPKDRTFDEHKVMLGFASGKDARAAYQANYQKGWKGFGAITRMSVDEFKQWVRSDAAKKPAAQALAAPPARDEAAPQSKVLTDERGTERPGVEAVRPVGEAAPSAGDGVGQDIGARWNALSVSERKALLKQPGGWGTAPGAKNELNTTGLYILKRGWSQHPESTQSTIAKLMAKQDAAQSPRSAPAVQTNKAELRPYRRADGSVGYEAVPIETSAAVESPSKQADTAQQETPDDSASPGNAPSLNQPLAEGVVADAIQSGEPIRGAEQASERAGRGNARGLRSARGRVEGVNDEAGHVGDIFGDGLVPDRSDGVVAGGVQGSPAHDYRATPDSLTREGSWYDTASRNIDLIELARKIESENRPATPEEQAQLAKYTGFGAGEIRNNLFPVPSGYARTQEPERLVWPNLTQGRWKPLAERMEALPREWQQSVLQSTQYAHYTSANIVKSMWSALERLGFTGGRVLEPGSGIGAFPMLMPDAVRASSRYTGIEFDGPTALIARLLSPQQNMMHADFIKRRLPADYFDVAIGNPPFSATKILADPDYAKHGFMLHDFFFAKALDRVRPGGLLAFVTSKGTMDKQSDKARRYLSKSADLVGAIRLPSTAFEANAGTSVVTDVIFLRKRADGEAPAGQAWTGLQTVDTTDGPVAINEYFAANPHMVLGQNRISGNVDDEGRRINSNGRGGEKYTVVSYDKTPADLDAKFAAAVEQLPRNVYSVMRSTPEQIRAETAKVDFAPGVSREGVVYLGDDGTLMRVSDGVGKPLGDAVKLSPKDTAWMKGYIGVRDLVHEARLAQASDGDWKAALERLNTAYDAFRAEHGPINDYRVLVRKSTNDEGEVVESAIRIYKNRRLFREDYDAALVTQLETITEAGEIVKAPFLRDRTVGKPVVREVKTVGDALAVSLDAHGRLNLDDVAERIGISRADAIDALGTQIYRTPQGEWQLNDEYLSGDVVSKLDEAIEAARADPTLRRNVEALEGVQPEKLGPSQISVKLGASWVPAEYVSEFAKEIEAGSVTFDPQTESWQVSGANVRNGRRAGAEFGTSDRSPSELLEDALNSRTVTIKRTTVDKKTVTDAEATAAANEVLRKMREKFKSWIWTDAERATSLVDAYNRQYNNIAPRRFDGSHLTLPGVSLRFKLHPHQLRAIWRQVQTGNTYLAHAVGAGKTIEMIAGGMEQKRLGLINKPMYVVPNHMLEQFSNEFMELYPLANIMVADDENFSADRRKAFVAAATLNGPDAIVITHSAYERIGVKEESVAPIRDEILTMLNEELDDADKGDRVRRSQLEQQIEAVTQRFERIVGAGSKDSTIKFEDIGADFVYVDEAHAFRKLDFTTNQKVKGIDPNGSKRALDMYVKTRWLEQQRPGRSMVFATGTPVTNTMGELYTIMRFFAPEALDRAGIATFDSWARMFGESVPALEANAAGRYETVTRFAKFDNVPELMSRVRQFMDVLTSESLGSLVKRPDLEGGRPHLVTVEPTDALKRYMKGVLLPRLEAARKWKPTKDQPFNPDPVIAITSDGRFAGLDPRFFGEKIDEDKNPTKLTVMADAIAAEYKATAANRYTGSDGKNDPIPGGTQIVFYNLGFGAQSQANRGFNAREALTKRMVAQGVKREHIAWFDDANTDAKKEAVFKAMRAGQVRVLLGSAKKMGTGVNVQKRLTHLHYFDPPWYPSDVEQPHGRIIRQGNQNPIARISWYATKGTYDSTMWQMVARKQRFIDQAFTGDKSMRSMDDMSEASAYEQAAAVASGDPRALQLAGLRQDVERFERLQAAHASEQIRVRSSLNEAIWSGEHQDKRIAQLEPAFKELGSTFVAMKEAKVGKTTFNKVGEFGQALKDAFNKTVQSIGDKPSKKPVQVGEFNGLPVNVQQVWSVGSPTDKFTLSVDVNGYNVDVATTESMGDTVDAVGLGRRVGNRLNDVETDLRQARAAKEASENDVRRLRKKLGAPFEFQQELSEKYGELKQLEDELRAEGEAAAAPPPQATAIDADGNVTSEDAPGAPAFDMGDRDAFPTERDAQHYDAINTAVRAITAKLGNKAPAVFVVPSAEDLPAKAKAKEPTRYQQARGFYDGRRVYLVASNLTPKVVLETLAHEAIGHFGVDRIIDDHVAGGWKRLEGDIARLRGDSTLGSKAMREAIDDVESRYPGADARTFARELVAVMAEKGVRNGIIDRVVAAVRAFLRKYFPNITHGEREIRALLQHSENFIRASDADIAAQHAAAGALAFDVAPARDTPAFKQWFARSKVERAGKPIIVHHGTAEDFTVFNDSKLGGATEHATAPLGHFFTENRSLAQRYAENASEGRPADERVIDAYLSIQKPYTMSIDQAEAVETPQQARALRARLEREGYDGIHMPEAKAWVAFESAQVKSTQNRGTFDRTNPDINFSLGTAEPFEKPGPSIEAMEETIREPDDRSAWDRAKAWMAGKAEDFRPAFLGALQRRHLTELMDDHAALEGYGKQYDERIQKLESDRTQMMAGAPDAAEHPNDMLKRGGATIAEDLRKFTYQKGLAGWAGRRNPEAKALADVMHAATMQGLDPSEEYTKLVMEDSKGELLPWTPAAIKERIQAIKGQIRGRPGDDKRAMMDEIKNLRSLPSRETARKAAWPKLLAQYQALSPEAKTLYKQTRDWYSQVRDETEKGLIARVEALGRDMAGTTGEDLAKRYVRQTVQRIRLQFEMNRLEGVYFPLNRDGDYWMSVSDKDGAQGFKMFETAAEAIDAEKALRAKGFKIEAQGRRDSDYRAKNAPTGTFIAEIIKTLKESGAPEKVQDEVYQTFLRTLPEMSMRKHSIHRKKVPGFESDALRAFSKNAFHGAHQLARLRHAHELQAIVEGAQTSLDNYRRGPELGSTSHTKLADVARGDALLGELKKRHDYIMAPKDSQLANVANSIGFLYYLGASPASAFVNLTQNAQVTLPVLASQHGWPKAARVMGAALRDAMRTLGNIDRTLTSPEERTAYQTLRARGDIDKTQSHTLAGLAEGNQLTTQPAWARAMTAIGFLFHRAEIINREAAGMAAYRLARSSGKNFQESVQYASDIINGTHFDYSASNRPRYMQGNVARIALQFKNYSVGMTWMLYRNLYQAVKGESPEVRSVARRTLTGILGTTALMAGTMGLPIINAVRYAAMAAHGLFGDDDPWDFDTEYRQFLADNLGEDAGKWVADGVVNRTGINLARRVSLSNLWFQDADRELEGKDAYYKALEDMVGPIGGIAKNLFVGSKMIGDGQVQRGVETMMPKFAKDAMKGLRFAHDGANTLRGDPIVADVSTPESFMQALGFQPTRLFEQQKKNSAMKNYEQEILDRRSALMNAYALAVRAGADSDLAMEKIHAFNRSYPEIAIKSESLRQSLRARARYSADQQGGVAVNKKLRPRLQEMTGVGA